MSSSVPRWYTALSNVLNGTEKSARTYLSSTSHERPRANYPHAISTVFQLATVDAACKPHVRTHVHRGFITPPTAPAHPLILTTTDIRSAKVAHITHDPAVSLAWWIGGSADQFCITGAARLVSPNGNEVLGVRDAAKADCPGLAALDADASFDWAAKRTELYDAVGSALRASFIGPQPGAPLEDGDAEVMRHPERLPNLAEAETEAEKRDVQAALKNFAIVIIEPVEVDWLQLGVMPNRRTKFQREGGVWKEVAVGP